MVYCSKKSIRTSMYLICWWLFNGQLRFHCGNEMVCCSQLQKMKLFLGSLKVPLAIRVLHVEFFRLFSHFEEWCDHRYSIGAWMCRTRAKMRMTSRPVTGKLRKTIFQMMTLLTTLGPTVSDLFPIIQKRKRNLDSGFRNRYCTLIYDTVVTFTLRSFIAFHL